MTYRTVVDSKQTYGKRFNGCEFLDNSFLFCQVGGTDSQSRSGDDRQTDWDTHDQKDQDVMKQVVGAVLWGSKIQMMEETTDPGDKDPQDDNNQKRRADRVHDSFEVTLVFSTLDKSCCTTDERSPCVGSDDAVCFAALAASGIVAGVAHILVDRQRFTGDGRLITSNKGDPVVMVTILVVFIACLLFRLLAFFFSHELLVFLESFGVIVGADETSIGWDDLPFFNDDLVKSAM